MPEGTRTDPRYAADPALATPVRPLTGRLRAALDLAPGARCGPVMTPERFTDRFRFFSDQPQQLRGVGILYDEILALPGGRTLLSEDSNWATEFSNTPPPPSPPAHSNPLDVKWQSQNDNLSGTGRRECFSSTCAMIAMFWGKVKNDDEYNKIRARFGDTTNSQAQLDALRSLGLTANFFTDGRLTDLHAEIDAGRPVATGWLHHGHFSNPSGGGHWTCVVGYTSNATIHHDPNGVPDLVNGGYTNNWHGEFVNFTNQHWLPRWEVVGGDGWFLTVRP